VKTVSNKIMDDSMTLDLGKASETALRRQAAIGALPLGRSCRTSAVGSALARHARLGQRFSRRCAIGASLEAGRQPGDRQ